ncbi:MAG: hypothetical protein LQ337_002890 [Flavoplaca oasis]|nr:MAG: hypothetical protein LQ337_002890 [Flavoplaca oasis]
MRPFNLAVLASILSFARAVPLEKRVLVIETVTNVVVQTVDVTTTVWVNPGAPSPKAQLNNHMNNHHAHVNAHKNKDKMKFHPPAQKEAVAPAQPQSSPPQEEAHQGPPAQQPAAQVAPVIPDPPQQVPPPVAPAPQDHAQAQAETQAQAQVEVAAPQDIAPQPAAPAPQPAAPASAPVAPAKSKEDVSVESGSTANCGEVGQPCSGEITFYDTGLGACGTTDDGLSENVFALAHGMMGEQSNGNPFCGRRAEVTLDGKTVVGKLVDKCMGCKGQDIDLSHKMFQALANEDRGRIADVKWKFID